MYDIGEYLLNNAEQYILDEIDTMNKLISKMTYFHPVRKHLEALVYEATLLNNKWRQIKDEALNEVVRMLKKGEKYNDYDDFTITILYHPKTIDIDVYVKGIKSTKCNTFITLDSNDAYALTLGWLASDGYIKQMKKKKKKEERIYIGMQTNYVWQTILFATLLNSDIKCRATGFTISDDDVKISWRLWTSSSSEALPTNKDEVFKRISNLPQQQFYESMFTLILGDGTTRFDTKRGIDVFQKKKERLEQIRSRLEKEGISSHIIKDKRYNVYNLVITGENALKLARKIKEAVPQKYREIINMLSQSLPENIRINPNVFKVYKWEVINKISEYKNGTMKIYLLQIPMTLSVSKDLKIEIVSKDKDYLQNYLLQLPVKAVIRQQRIKGKEFYKLVIRWTEVKKLLCDENIKEQILNKLQERVTRCAHTKEQECYAEEWLRKVQAVKCQDPAQRGPGPNPPHKRDSQEYAHNEKNLKAHEKIIQSPR